MKRCKMGILLLLIMIIPKNVWAFSGSLSLTCPAEAKVGETVTCSINGYADEEIFSIELPFSLTNASAVSFKKEEAYWDFANDVSNNKIQHVAIVNSKLGLGEKKNFPIGVLTIKLTGSAGSEAVLTFNNGIFVTAGSTLENMKQNSIPMASKSIKIKAESTTPVPTKTPTPTPTKTPTPTQKPAVNPTKTPTPTPKQNNNNNNNGGSNNQTQKNNSTVNNTEINNNSNDSDNKELDKSNNNTVSKKYLSNIIVSNYTLNFDETVYSYDLRINDEDSLEIIPIFADNNLKYEIIGNENLTDGSVIAVNITDEEDNQVTYYINIIKENNVNNNSELKEKNGKGSLILIIIAILLIIINVARLILKSKDGEVKNEE